MVENPRFPHTCKIIRPGATNPMDDSTEGTVIYSGKCRSYQETAVTTTGAVITSNRKVALPVKQTEWTEDTIPLEGDIIIVFRTGYNEQGYVVDKLPNNFGTDVLWKYNRA